MNGEDGYFEGINTVNRISLGGWDQVGEKESRWPGINRFEEMWQFFPEIFKKLYL